MEYLSLDYLYFVPGKIVNGEDVDCNSIYIYSSMRNGKIRKKKKDIIGLVSKHPKTKKWCAKQADNSIWGYKTCIYVSKLIYELDNKKIIFNPEEGVLRTQERK